jgi:F-type H+-transporting ATPase subunit delta
MKAHSETVARRLAQALLDAESVNPTGPALALQCLAESRQVLAQCAEARKILEHPLTPSPAKEAILAAVTRDAAGSAAVRQLLRILAARQALSLLPAIEAALLALWNARCGVVAAEASSATPLAADVVEQLRRALERTSQRKVELTTTVVPELVGGVIVRFAGRVLDGSVRGRLKALRERLRQAATL